MTATFVQHNWFGHQHVREDAACNNPHPSPLLSGQHVSRHFVHTKRKQADTSQSPVGPAKRLKNETLSSEVSGPSKPAAPELPTNVEPTAATSGNSLGLGITSPTVETPTETHTPVEPRTELQCRNKAYDRISMFLNTNVLLKHKELRLIEAEIAKCQVALEQLRRCRAIPYPGEPSSITPIETIITGTGPALEPPADMQRPSQPTPFGIADGPYTRHYAAWLMPDPTFDPSPIRARGAPATPAVVPGGRKIRHLEDAAVPRLKRITTSMFLQLPTSAFLFKDNRNRLIVRNNDGEWVKVVCRECGKADSANLQGFTNHTRIAHSTSYTKHDDAVKECGLSLSDEEKAVVDSASTLLDDAPATAKIPTPVAQVKPLQAPVRHGEATMIRASSSLSASAQALHQQSDSLPRNAAAATGPVTQTSTNFVSSRLAPGLSNLLMKCGASLNLHNLVSLAQQKVDLDAILPITPDEDIDAPTAEPNGQYRGAVSRMPARVHISDTPDNTTTSPSSPKTVRQASSHSSAAVSPRVSDSDPGMVSDHGDEDEDAHSLDHGEEDETQEASIVRIREGGHEHDEAIHDVTQQDAPSFFSGFSNAATKANSEKKKRGRPRKNP